MHVLHCEIVSIHTSGHAYSICFSSKCHYKIVLRRILRLFENCACFLMQYSLLPISMKLFFEYYNSNLLLVGGIISCYYNNQMAMHNIKGSVDTLRVLKMRSNV